LPDLYSTLLFLVFLALSDPFDFNPNDLNAITRRREENTNRGGFFFGIQVFGHAGPNMHETKLLGFDNILALYDPWRSKTRRNTRPTNWKNIDTIRRKAGKQQFLRSFEFLDIVINFSAKSYPI